MNDPQVLVVGAGPAGALLSWLLASRGVSTVLVERQSDFAREFRGEVLMPSGLRALEDAGIGLASVAHRDPARLRLFFRRQPVFEVAASDIEGAVPRVVSQPDLLEHLVERAAETGRFELIRGGAVRELLREGDRVVGARVEQPDGGRDVRARLVVGADGRASVVRRKLGLEVHDRGAPMDVVWCKMPWPGGWPDGELRGYVGGGHLLIALPAPSGELQVAWVILKGTYGDLRRRGIEEWVRAMADHVGADLAPHLREQADAIKRPFLLDAVTDCVHGWTRPGALVIGDAAHTMSPVGGQGLNVAMRDAVVAANHLVPAALAGGDLDAAAARVEPERRPEIDEIQQLAALPPRVVMGSRFYHGWLRALAAFALRLGPARGRAAGVASKFFDGVTDVSLRV